MQTDKKCEGGWLARVWGQVKKTLKIGGSCSSVSHRPTEKISASGCCKWPAEKTEKVEDLQR